MRITCLFQVDDRGKHRATQEKAKALRRHSARWGAALLAGCAVAAISGCEKKEAPPPPAPPDVRVAEVMQQNVPIFNEWVAQLNGPVNADITPKVQGYLLKQVYQNGYFVKKGQLLFELDPRQYEAAVEAAKASLAASQAELGKYQNDVVRDTPLAAQNAIPQKQLDTDTSNRDAAAADVKAKQADLDNAQLNLAWTKVYSPIDGIAGVSNSQIGDLVGTTTKMATVSQVNPIWAYWNISESQFLGVATRVTGIISGKSTDLGRTPVEFIQANDVPYPQKGKFVYVNRAVGTSTGTIQIAAAFANPQAVLRPGGYGRVRIQTGNNQDALLVPQPAVIEVQSNYMLLVLTPDNKAHFRPVKMGPRVGPNWIVSEGVKPGEKVVVEGIERLQMAAAAMPQLAKEGIPVNAQPYTPAATAAPAGGGN
ncbi:MAG: efflux RND transporter periplasmic adaptor subunit [Silvibacterium sp.]|nr:efflux RND transporter periplasmic adaptor subunit [Silvibacterium sp.]